MTGLWLISYIALWILFLVVAVVLLSVLRNLGTMYETLAAFQNPPEEPIRLVAGDIVPDLTLPALSGDRVPISAFRGQTTAFLIISPGCSPCHSLLKDIADNDDPYPRDPAVRRWVIVSSAGAPETAGLIEQVGLRGDIPVLIDAESGVRKAWGINGTPTTVIVDEQLRFIRHSVGYAERPAGHAEPAART